MSIWTNCRVTPKLEAPSLTPSPEGLTVNYRRMTAPRCSRITMIALIAVAAASWLAWSPRSAAAQDLPTLLAMAPDDAQLIIAAPSLARLGDRLADANSLLNMEVTWMRDPINEFKRATSLNRGLKDDGGFMIVFSDLKFDDATQPNAMVICEVADYADFISNFEGAGVDEVTVLKLSNGQTAYSKLLPGGYAVISARRERIELYQPGKGDMLSPPAAKGTLGSSALVAIVQVKAGRQILKRRVAELIAYLEPIKPDPVTDDEMEAKSGMPTSSSSSSEDVTFWEELIEQSETVAVGINFTDEGLSFTVANKFVKDAPVLELIKGGKAVSLGLQRLPSGPYTVAGSVGADGTTIKKLLNAFIVTRESDPRFRWAPLLMERADPVLSQIKAITPVLYVPQGLRFGATPFNGVFLIETDDGARFVKSFEQMLNQLSANPMDLGNLPDARGNINPSLPGVTLPFNTVFNANELEVDDLKVSAFSVNAQLPPRLMMNMSPAARKTIMFGGSSQNGYIVASGRFVVMTTVRDVQLIRAALITMKRGDGVGRDEVVATARRNLIAEPSLEAYFSLPGIASSMNMLNQLTMLGKGRKITLPNNLQPIGMAITHTNDTAAVRGFLPISVVRYFYDQIEEAAQLEAERLAAENSGNVNNQQGARRAPTRAAAQPTRRSTATQQRPAPANNDVDSQPDMPFQDETGNRQRAPGQAASGRPR